MTSFACTAMQASVSNWWAFHFTFLRFPLWFSTEHPAFCTTLLLEATCQTCPLLLRVCSSLLFSALRVRRGQRRYSSLREREIRGPFLISFLFSSFLLLFSSSLRIFWKASAVWSIWSGRERFLIRALFGSLGAAGPTCATLTHVISLCAVGVCEVRGFLCYPKLLWHLRSEASGHGDERGRKRRGGVKLLCPHKRMNMSLRQAAFSAAKKAAWCNWVS